MAEYEIGGTTVRRKNLYMPCIIGPVFDEATPEEQARILKATFWADNITNSEWPVVLDHDEATKVNRSRLKKKGAGWMMALARIAYLNPDMFRAMCAQARTMYVDQIEEEFPWSAMVLALSGLREAEVGESVVVSIRSSLSETS